MDLIYKNDNIEFVYNPYTGDCRWLIERLNELDPSDENDVVHVAGTFFFKNQDLLKEDDEYLIFLLGNKNGNYYKINGQKLGVSYDVYFDVQLKLNFKMVSASKYKNVFQYIEEARTTNNDLYIGGQSAEISVDDFINIITNFPTNREKELYLQSKIQFTLENYFENLKDYNGKLDNYLMKKNRNNGVKSNKQILLNDINKYKYILNNLERMLEKTKVLNYTEAEWGRAIADILLLVFPKYINYHTEVYINLTSRNSKKKKERVDFVFVKSDGTIDLLEIKKPNDVAVISKSLDHDNYYATNSLSKVTMQIEKYLYNISRNACSVERDLEIKYLNEYSRDFKFNVVNPKGMILIGSSSGYDDKRLSDLEVIKRMYYNIIDIYTYDDLIDMLRNIIFQLEKKINL